MCEEAGVGVQPALPSVRQRSQVPSPLREKVRMRVNQRKPFIRFPSPSSSPLGGEEILGKILPFPKKKTDPYAAAVGNSELTLLLRKRSKMSCVARERFMV